MDQQVAKSGDAAVFFEHEFPPKFDDPLARSVRLNGELIDVNRKLQNEAKELVNALETSRRYIERDDPEEALKAITAALTVWGQG